MTLQDIETVLTLLCRTQSLTEATPQPLAGTIAAVLVALGVRATYLIASPRGQLQFRFNFHPFLVVVVHVGLTLFRRLQVPLPLLKIQATLEEEERVPLAFLFVIIFPHSLQQLEEYARLVHWVLELKVGCLAGTFCEWIFDWDQLPCLMHFRNISKIQQIK